MTRELKIALLIGFCLVLVVSVLIADHLSAARNAKLAEASGESLPLVQDPLGAVDPIDAVAPGTGITPGPLALGNPLPISEPGTIDATNPNATSATDPDAYAMVGATAVKEPVANSDTSSGTYVPYTLVQGSGTAANGTQPGTPLAAHNPDPSLGDIVREVGGNLANGTIDLPAAVKTTLTTNSPDPTTIVEPFIEPVRPAPQDTYTVKSGDNLYKIAKKHYGSGEQWKILADANKDKISKNGNLKVGTVLVVPAAKPSLAKADTTPQSKPAKDTRSTTPGRNAEPTKTAKADSKPTQKGTTYTVKRGDSLGVISQTTLGTSRRMNEILAANKGKISDADDLRVGMVLAIPAR